MIDKAIQLRGGEIAFIVKLLKLFWGECLMGFITEINATLAHKVFESLLIDIPVLFDKDRNLFNTSGTQLVAHGNGNSHHIDPIHSGLLTFFCLQFGRIIFQI